MNKETELFTNYEKNNILTAANVISEATIIQKTIQNFQLGHAEYYNQLEQGF